MEERSLPLDVGLRSIEVRVTDSSADSDLPTVGNLNSCALQTFTSNRNHGEKQVQRTSITEDRALLNAKDIVNVAGELEEKLHIGCTSSTSSTLLNGCNTSFYSDAKCIDCVDHSVNGLSKCYGKYRVCSIADNQWKGSGVCITRNERDDGDAQIPWIDKSGDSDSEGKVLDVDHNSLCGVHSRPVCLSEINKTKGNVLSSEKPNDGSHKSEHSCSGDIKVDGTVGVTHNQAEIPITYVGYESENQMPDIMRLIQKDLSEPYSIYTYRYFIHNWPKLCFLALHGEKCVGAIVCKLDVHKKHSRRGYIAMLAVDENYRKRRIGSNLVLKAIQAMVADNADEVVLETEITNKPALKLYENLGFVRDKRLFRYYLNGVDALRLKLWLR